MSPKIVLSYPYEGGMYYLLNQHLPWVPSAVNRTEGYYPVLFGPQAQLMKAKATALGALFDEVILVSADSSLPDRESSESTDGSYWHRDLRIRVPNPQYAEWSEENVALGEELLADVDVVAALNTHFSYLLDPHDRLQRLCRLLSQMRAAHEYDAVIVGNSALCALHAAVLARVTGIEDKAGVTHFTSDSLTLDTRTLSLVGLEFNCHDLDAFAAVRQSNEIRNYADQFRNAVSAARSAADVERSLLLLMKEARETHQIATKIAGGFETTTSITSLAGLIPGVGTVASLVALGTDATARSARLLQGKREWYALGSKMNQVAVDDLLARL